jgi:hypothetical protein
MVALPAVNLVAVLVATGINMAVGMVWYSPKVFGGQWMALSGITPQQMEEMKRSGKPQKAMGLMLLVALWSAFSLAVAVRWAGVSTALDGAVVGVLVWLGFVATSSAASVLFEGKPVKLYLLNNGHYAVNFLVSGALLAAWP